MYNDRHTVMHRVDLAAGGGSEELLLPNPFADAATPSAKVVNAEFFPDAAVATHATNYMTAKITNLADDSDYSGDVTTNSSGGAALAKGTATSFDMTGGDEAPEVAQGSCARLDKTENGTGADLVGFLAVTWERNRYALS